MNSVIISGTIKNIVYKLVDRGNIYALIILKLEVEKCKKNIEIIGKEKYDRVHSARQSLRHVRRRKAGTSVRWKIFP